MPNSRPLLCAALAISLLLSACGSERRVPPNVLLIVVDTLRADHVGPQADRESLTPHLDRFASRAWTFPHATSPRAKTNPAVATLMTGLYPHEHGVRDLISPLRKDVPTLAEQFAAEGYRTGGIVGNFVLQNRWSGLGRGFEHWNEELPDLESVPPHNVPSRNARSLTQGALCALGLGDPDDRAGPSMAWLDSSQPWFLYLHYMDPHGAYSPPEAYLPEPGESEWVEHSGSVPHNVPEECLDGERFDAACVRARYAGEVRFVDAEIGRLLQALQAQGQLEDTVVVITSDHGESLGEHDYWFEHGLHAYEATCHVPLLLHVPKAQAAAHELDVSLADLAPTLLDLCGFSDKMRSDQQLRGHSKLDRILAGEQDSGAPVFCEKIAGAELARTKQIKAARSGRWKLLRNYAFRLDRAAAETEQAREMRVVAEELFDLSEDPNEERNLIAEPPAEAPLAQLRRALDEFQDAELDMAELARNLEAAREAHRTSDPEREQLLRALGY